MAAVLTLLIVLPAITLWVVDRSITQQTREDAGSALTTARAVFLQSLGNRAGSLGSRYRNVAGDSALPAQWSRLKDASTMWAYLRDLLEEFADDTELLAFVTPDGKLLVSAEGTPARAARPRSRSRTSPARPQVRCESLWPAKPGPAARSWATTC